MTELLDAAKNNATAFGGYIAAALVSIAYLLPKLTNGMKADRIDGKLLERLDDMDTQIHKTQVRVTRLVVLVIEMNALLMANGVDIPERMKKEMRDLTKDPLEPENDT